MKTGLIFLAAVVALLACAAAGSAYVVNEVTPEWPERATEESRSTKAPEDLTATAYEELENTILAGDWPDDQTRWDAYDRWVTSGVLTEQQFVAIVVFIYEQETGGTCRMFEDLSVACDNNNTFNWRVL